MRSKASIIAMTMVLWCTQPLANAQAERAQDIVAVCSGCHGSKGHSVVPDNPILAGQHGAYLAIALQEYVSGARDYAIMSTLAGRLSPADIEVVSAYYAAQPPAQSHGKASGDVGRGETRTAVCAACHGAGGRSVIPANPKLAGQHAKYLSTALTAYKNGGRSNPIMAPMAAALSEQDIEDIAAYYAAQPLQASGEDTQ